MYKAAIIVNDQNKFFHFNKAAGRMGRKILAEALASSTNDFLQKVNLQKGMTGLNMGCGTGEVTLELAALVGNEGKVIGLDQNETIIKIAQEKAARQNSPNVEFTVKEISKWQESSCYDFLYSRLFLNQLNDPLAVLKQSYESLKKGGIVLVEEMDFSNNYCYPSCYAFDRYMELFIEVKKRKGKDANIGNKLFSLLEQAGFQKIQVQLIPPSFLKAEHKAIASLTLESISEILLLEELITSVELEALLFELKAFENRKSTMILLPGIYQTMAYKF